MKLGRLLSISMLSAAVLTACTNNDDKSEWNDGSQAINFTSSIQGLQTRAANNAWSAGDQIGIFMKAVGGDLNAATAANKLHTTDASGNLTASNADNALYYPSDGSSVDFVAYYPYTASLASNVYKVDVADQTNQPAIDLLYSNNAKGFAKSASTNPQLQFSHVLSQIVFNIEKDATVPSLAGLKVTFKGLNTKADFALANGQLSNAASVADVAAAVNVTAATATSIVLPAAALSDVKVVFELNGKTYTADYPQATLAGGSKYTHKVKLSDSNGQATIVVEAATITDWVAVPGADINVDFGGGSVTPDPEPEPEPTPTKNLVLNPGFENWTATLPTSWDNAYNTGIITKSTDVKHSGSNALKQMSGSQATKVQQEFAIVGGKKYQISYWYLDNDAKAKTRMWTFWLNGSSTIADNLAEFRPDDYSIDSADWKQNKMTLTAPAAANGLRLEVRTYRESTTAEGGFIYYDDFEVIEVTD